jgi:hypothetical protein
MKKTSEIKISPNPTDGIVRIEGESEELSNYSVSNIIGQDVSSQVNFVENAEHYIIIDLSGLPSGLYFVRTKTRVCRVYRE